MDLVSMKTAWYNFIEVRRIAAIVSDTCFGRIDHGKPRPVP